MKEVNIQDYIIFIAETRAPNANGSSTNRMTDSILHGIKENGERILFFPICEYKGEEKDIENYYSQFCDEVIVLPSIFGPPKSRIERLIKLSFYPLFKGKYKKVLKKQVSFIGTPKKIIAHSPSVEGVLYCDAVKKMYKNVEYIQYWSDPIVLSNATPDNIGIKRLPFKISENRLLKNGDKIIYGTKTLMQFQKQIFKKKSKKMRYVDVAYSEISEENIDFDKKYQDKILYSGRFNKEVRNIEPLVEAMKSIPNLTLDIYGQGQCDKKADNVNFCGLVTPDKMQEMEKKYQTIVCLLNSQSIQIPGKIFYSMANDCNILVIADGTNKKEIIEHLKEYKRFVICDNDADSIVKALKNIKEKNYDLEYIKDNFSAKVISKTLLDGGKE